MRLAVLGSRSRQGPDCIFEIDFAPGDLRDFLPALSRQSKDLDNTSVSATDLPGGGNDAAEFVDRQDAVACDLARRGLEAIAGRAIKNRFAHTPAEKGFGQLQCFIGRDGSSTVDDLADEFDEVPPGDLVDGPRAPTIYELAFQDAADLNSRAPFRDMLRDENLNEVVDTIGRKPSPRLSLLEAGSRPSILAARMRWASLRAICRVTRPYGPMVYLRSREPAPDVLYRTMKTFRPAGVTLTPNPGRVASQYTNSDGGVGSASMAVLVSRIRGISATPGSNR